MGLNVLLGLRREALDQGRTVTVRAYSATVGRLLELTGARELFVTEPFARPEGAGGPAAGPVPGPVGVPVPVVEEQPQPMDVDQELRLEVDQLRRAMRTRPAIDVARGIAMASFGLSAEDAWTVLVTASQNTNTKLHELAQELMGAIQGAAVPEQLHQQMAAAVAKVREQGQDQQGPDQQAPPPPAA